MFRSRGVDERVGGLDRDWSDARPFEFRQNLLVQIRIGHLEAEGAESSRERTVVRKVHEGAREERREPENAELFRRMERDIVSLKGAMRLVPSRRCASIDEADRDAVIGESPVELASKT